MANTRRPTAATPGASRAGSAGRNSTATTAVTVALVVLACFAAVAYLAFRGGGSAANASPASTQLGSVTCSSPPALPASPASYSSPPDPSLAQQSTWIATIHTTCGDITLQLYGDKAPQTVSSFLFLAQHGFWADSPCHRLTTAGIFVLQCGDPTGTGGGGPGYGFGIENAPANGQYPTGAVAMARSSAPTSNGSQFFFVYADTTLPTSGGGYSIFGQVTSGMDIVKAIAGAGVSGGATDGAPAQPISILSVSVRKS